MKTWQHAVLTVFACALLGGILYLILLPNRGSPIALVTKTPNLTPQPSATLAEIRVHITGAVNQPGIITLPKGARLADALEKAGGLTEGYDSNLLNLSEMLSDGQRVHIPRLTEQNASTPFIERGQPSINIEETPLININTADLDTLCLLPGIGPTKAQAIIQYREEHGLFMNLTDLQKVKGIGTSIYNKILNLITLGD